MRCNFTTHREESVTYTSVCCETTIHHSVLMLDSNTIFEKNSKLRCSLAAIILCCIFSWFFYSVYNLRSIFQRLSHRPNYLI